LRADLELHNKTRYDTRTLRSIFTWCIKDRELRKHLRVFVVSGRARYGYRPHVSGLAVIGGSRVTMKLPITKTNLRSLAQVFVHELQHIEGISSHRDMVNCSDLALPGFPQEWEGVEITPAPKSKPDPIQVLERKLAKSLKMVKRWETANKRAQTMLKKWQRRAASCERRLNNEKADSLTQAASDNGRT